MSWKSISPLFINRSALRSENAMAVIAVMVLLSLILVFIVGNLGTINHLGRDLRLVEERQKRHWSTLAPPKSSIQSPARRMWP